MADVERLFSKFTRHPVRDRTQTDVGRHWPTLAEAKAVMSGRARIGEVAPVWLATSQIAPSLAVSIGRHPRSLARSTATEAAADIGRLEPMRLRTGRLSDQNSLS